MPTTGATPHAQVLPKTAAMPAGTSSYSTVYRSGTGVRTEEREGGVQEANLAVPALLVRRFTVLWVRSMRAACPGDFWKAHISKPATYISRLERSHKDDDSQISSLISLNSTEQRGGTKVFDHRVSILLTPSFEAIRLISRDFGRLLSRSSARRRRILTPEMDSAQSVCSSGNRKAPEDNEKSSVGAFVPAPSTRVPALQRPTRSPWRASRRPPTWTVPTSLDFVRVCTLS